MSTGKEEYITKREIALEKDKKYYFVTMDQYWDIIELDDEISDIKKYLEKIERQRLEKKAADNKPKSTDVAGPAPQLIPIAE